MLAFNNTAPIPIYLCLLTNYFINLTSYTAGQEGKLMKKLTTVLAMVVAAIAIPTALFAWGPIRDENFTIASPAPYITFNSITDNPNIGDERNFVGIRETGTTNAWSDNVTVVKGKQYTVRMYVHNNAAENLNLVAENVTAKFNLPTTTAKSIQVNGFLSSSNAKPTEVYDDATFTSSEVFNLAYVSGSLKYENNFYGAAGIALPESIFTSTGARIGYDNLEGGKIPGCFKYAGYITFTVTPQFAETPTFTVSKQVHKTGVSGNWTETVAVNPGDSVDYLITYKNTSTVAQNDVTIYDTLPADVTYTAGSTVLTNGNYPTGKKVSDGVTTSGINIGDYAANATGYIKFSATVDANNDLTNCGINNLSNKVKVTTPYGSKEDTAEVTVTKTCTVTPPELPHTGAGEGIVAILGLGATITSLGYYLASRRVLNR